MKIVTLDSVLDITSGAAFKSSFFNDSGKGLPLIRCRDINSGFAGVYYSGDYEEQYLVNNDNILVSMDGDFRIVRWSNGKALLNQRTCRLEPHIDKLSPSYLLYFLPAKLETIHRKTAFATVKHLSVNDIRNIDIPLPPLPEQKRIAAILDQADAIRKKRRQAIDELNNLIHAAFAECFCESMTDNSCHDDLVNLADIVSGVTKGRKFNGRPTVMLPYIRVANVQAGYLELSEIKDIEALPVDLEKYRLEYGDVLLTEGGDYDKLGRGTMWEGQIEDCIHQNHVFRVRVNKELVLPEYFDVFLQTQFAKAYFLRCAKKTSNLASINMTQLRKLPVPVPKMSLQSKFAGIYHKHNDMAKLLKITLGETSDLFNSLVQRAFKGEL